MSNRSGLRLIDRTGMCSTIWYGMGILKLGENSHLICSPFICKTGPSASRKKITTHAAQNHLLGSCREAGGGPVGPSSEGSSSVGRLRLTAKSPTPARKSAEKVAYT